MFFVLGYSQEHRPVESMITTRCGCCSKDTSWMLWRETGWVSVLFLRVLPLSRQEWLICEECDDSVHVDRQTAKMALGRESLSPMLKQIIHDRLVTLIDMHQSTAGGPITPRDVPQPTDHGAR